MEIYASEKGIGTMLMQLGKPIAYLRKAFIWNTSNYAHLRKEMLAIVTTMQKWRLYLLVRHFKIRIDNQSLKYLPQQRITTSINISV